MDVRLVLKARYPDAKFGWPGLSPGGGIAGVRADELSFLANAKAATDAADWVGLHCYWLSDAERQTEAGGLSFLEYSRRFPNKLLFVTEFANVARSYDPPRGAEYVAYWKALRHVKNLGAAFAFVVSASNHGTDPVVDPGFRYQVWRSESGELSGIPGIVGAAMASIQATPVIVEEKTMSDADRATLKAEAANLRRSADTLDDIAAPKWWTTKVPPYKLAATGKVIPLYNADATRRSVAPIERTMPGAGSLPGTWWNVSERKGDLLRVTDFRDAARADWWVRAETVSPA
jgi:hypothetical protein